MLLTTIKSSHIRVVNFVFVPILLLIIACGGSNENNKKNPTPSVSIHITPSLTIRIGETDTLYVTTQNTDFTLSPVPVGSGCAKSSNTVSCSPTATGTYDIIVIATENTSKAATARITVYPADHQTAIEWDEASWYMEGDVNSLFWQ